MAQQPDLRPYPFTLKPGEPRLFHVTGNFLYVESANLPFEFSIGADAFMACKQGLRVKPDVEYTAVTLRVREGTADVVTGRIVLGHGSIDDASPTVFFNIEGAFVDMNARLLEVRDGIAALNTATATVITRLTEIRDNGGAGGGGATQPAFSSYADLGNLATVALAVGRYAAVIIGAGPLETWQLVADSSNPATDTANGTIRPIDYNSGSNAKVWMRR